MSTTDALTNLFRHHQWANLRLFELCAALTPEQLNAAIPGTYGAIRDTLQHLVTSEQSYFSRISTGKRSVRPPDAPPMSFEEMIEALRHTGAGLIAWAPRVQAEDTVEIDWDGTMRDTPKTVLLTQAINHATEHRAHVMTILTQIGIEPPELDSWAYFDQLYSSQQSPGVS
jgi:uncharacterized damage-inducible protein DinB